ncbi:pumilio homolog 24 [Rhododendron vialii]|uniref:pumilio homolog 24 n=1 Tax=Rhododendron vialii TaxID=182163 RepID=UPI00265EA4C4|nr:pumilio homolog 24 [Rhododendron vialii]
MAAKGEGSNESKKRKRPLTSSSATDSSKGEKPSNPKKVKLPSSSHPNKGANKPFKSTKRQSQQQQPLKFKSKFGKSDTHGEKTVPKTKRELRLQAKELAEARKKKRKPHYTLEQELASLWEKMRQRNIAKQDRSKLVSEALRKMKGKIHEIASSHVSSRVLQTCVKNCSQAERDAVYEELRPHFITLACNTYAVHLVKKMLDNASKKQLAEFISFLHGHVAALLRHMVGSVVIEHAYQLGNTTQKQALLLELYSTELQLFKDLVSMKESKLVDVISRLGLQKTSVLRHMSSVIQPILEKGIVDHSIIHKALIEYLSIADPSSAADVIEQLSGPLLVRMVHSKEGSRIAMLCIKHGSAKERKKFIKGMKGFVGKIANDQRGNMVLVCILSIVDDTKLGAKVVVRELQAILKELVLDKNGRRPLLQLLHPNCPRYFSPDDLASLDLSIPSLCTKGGLEVNSDLDKLEKSSKVGEDVEEDNSDTEDVTTESDKRANEGGKKDPFLRRQELLVNSGLAESLIDTCIESAGELLRSNFGKEVIYEVATGGAGGILRPVLDAKLEALYEAIASLAAQPNSEEEEEDHLLENFHSSRTIRRLVLDCPIFASTLWKKALKGKCKTWAQGHSSRVVCAFMESSDSAVQALARKELQPLVDGGILKLPENKQLEKQVKVSKAK